MPIVRRIPLTPCDYLYYAHHRMLQRSVNSGNIAFMMFDVAGRPDPDRIRSALAGAMLAHPVTVAQLKVSLRMGRPYWKIPRRLPQAARLAAERAHAYDDLRAVGDWQARVDRLCRERYRPEWDLAAGPQVRLEQYALPDGNTRFCIRWPHLMMDAEGAQLFLAEIGCRHVSTSPGDDDSDTGRAGEPGLPPEILRDDQTIDVLGERSFGRRLELFRHGFALGGHRKGLNIRPLVQDTNRRLTDFGLIHRNWDPGQTWQIQTNAKRTTPAGPALYARYLAACVIRALHRIHTETGVDTDAYLVTLPTRVTMRGPDGTILARRPVPGNYLVSPTLCCRRDLAGDKRAVGEDILSQLDAYRRAEADLMQWAMVRMASYMRASWYAALFKLPLGFESLSSGFSYYGEAARRVRSIGGAKVTNLWGGGPLATPPGWNPVFSRFQDRINFSLTWNRPAVPDDLARRYVELIESEIFETP